jgi:hypothetical protein
VTSRYRHGPAALDLAIVCGSAMSTKECTKKWTEPEAEWVPLKQAIFRFGVADAENGTASDLSNAQLYELKEAEIGVSVIALLSLAQLTEVLKDKSGASTAAIDVPTSTFSIHFAEGRTRSFKGAPWELLNEIPHRVIYPDTYTSHMHTFSLEQDFEEKAKRGNAVRAAINLVWLRLMIPAFNRAIETGKVALYARSRIDSVYFERLPDHIWPLINVVDWDHGVAMAVDRTTFWHIHAELTAIAKSASPGFDDSEVSLPSGLRKAPRSVVCKVIEAVYDEAEDTHRKPPNIKELPPAVLRVLQAQGYCASKKLIMQLGKAPGYAARRCPRGKRLSSQRNPQAR